MTATYLIRLLIASLVAGLTLAAGTATAGGPVLSTGPSVPLKMRQSILADLTGNATGFAYAIVKGGKLSYQGGVGFARTGPDGSVAMTASHRVNVMSVTKPITAVATHQLLGELDLSVDSPVAPWLPSAFPLGDGFDTVTFRQLLNHTSGMNQLFKSLSDADRDKWGNDWDGLKFVVSNDITPGSASSYKNANYALLRLAIPALWKATGNHPGIGQITKTSVGIWYLAYVQQRIFVPAGVQAVTCTEPKPDSAALLYDAANTAAGGKLVHIESGPLDGCGGHANLRLSALDLARFMAYLTHGKLLNTAGTTLMDSARLGWDKSSNSSSAPGVYWHGGDGMWKSGGANREVHTCVMKFPNDIQATLVINSTNQSGSSQCGVLLNAYKDAVS
jgi:CubicO group peptidase (beta-lactamase class C family)